MLDGIELTSGYDVGVDRLRADVRIVLPFSPEFGVFGGDEAQAGGLRWALLERVAQVRGVCACAHGLVGLVVCPGECTRLFDHGMMWVPVGEGAYPKPFLLAHTYGYGPEYRSELDGYARAWGLDVVVDGGGLAGDGWYSGSTTSVRVWAADQVNLWPLERDLALLLTAYPVRWPDEIVERIGREPLL